VICLKCLTSQSQQDHFFHCDHMSEVQVQLHTPALAPLIRSRSLDLVPVLQIPDQLDPVHRILGG
jgi:hypothetical protein